MKTVMNMYRQVTQVSMSAERLEQLYFVRAIDGVWLPECDREQYEAGNRQPSTYLLLPFIG